jgi:hypothetical protein
LAKFAVKFLSGKYQGGEFPLPDEGEIIIGRSSDLDMVLVEDMVSRKHAKISVSGNKVNIIDLGSTNGTFINGKKTRRADLKIADRILVGTSILKLIKASDMITAAASASSQQQARDLMEDIAASASETSTMSGELEDVPLPDLIQLFASNQKSGTLTVTGANRGKIFIKDGQILYAVIGGEVKMQPMKALCRMVTWSRGHFSMEPGEPNATFPQQFKQSTESILLEALRQADELRRMFHTLPPPSGRLILTVPLRPPLKDLDADELEILQSIINFSKMKSVVDKSQNTDHEVCKCIHKLLSEGYIEVVS